MNGSALLAAPQARSPRSSWQADTACLVPVCSRAQRYRALFGLRNKGGREAVEALGEAFKCRSALLKHEIAYVMGQMQVREGFC